MDQQTWTKGVPLTLNWKDIELRSLGESDLDSAAAAVMQGRGGGPGGTQSVIRARIAELAKRQDHAERFVLGIFRAGTKQCAGCCTLFVNATGTSANLSFMADFNAEAGHKFGGLVFTIVCPFVFDTVGVHRLEITVPDDFPGLRSFLDRNNVVREVTRRAVEPDGHGGRRDRHLYAVLEREWRARQAVEYGRASGNVSDETAFRTQMARSGAYMPDTSMQTVRWPAWPKPREAMTFAVLHQLETSERWPPEVLRAHQFYQANILLRHAFRTVPYYQDTLAGISHIFGRGLDDELWSRVPILTRSDIQDAGSRLESDDLPEGHGKAHDVRTSGSTGTPISVKGTAVTGLFFEAIHMRYHLWHRRDFATNVACIRSLNGRLSETARKGQKIAWASIYPTGPMSLFDITRPVTEQLDWLLDENPAYVLTFPSNLAALLKLSDATGRKPERIRQAITMSEVLEPGLRAECERVWGVPLIDSYSAEELGVIAAQCPDHPHYHVMAENVLVEILDGDGRPVPPGEVGRVVVTDLHNFATPLIRYEIGDHAEAGAPCDCGRGLPVLNRILGRTRNMLTLPDGAQFWPSLPEDRIMPIAPIRQFQVIQKSLEEIEVKLRVERPLESGEEDELRAVLTDVFRHPFQFDLVYVDEIPRAANGKFEDFRSLVDAETVSTD